MDTLRDLRNYSIASAVLTALVWVPAAVLFVVSIFTARRRGDAARSWLIWLKVALFFFTWFCLFAVVSYAINIAYVSWDDGWSYSDYSTAQVLLLASNQTRTVSTFLQQIVDILLMLLLVSVGGGISTALNGKPSSLARIYKFASWGLAGILIILSITALGLDIRINIAQYEGDLSLYNLSLVRQFEADVRLTFAISIILWAVSISLFIRSCQIRWSSKGDSRVATASNFLIATSFLFLIVMTTTVAIQLAYWDIANPTHTKNYDLWAEIIRVIFMTWPSFVILVLLYFLGVRKGANGLWSSDSAPYDRQAYGAAMPQQQFQQYAQPSQFQTNQAPVAAMTPPKEQQQFQQYSPPAQFQADQAPVASMTPPMEQQQPQQQQFQQYSQPAQYQADQAPVASMTPPPMEQQQPQQQYYSPNTYPQQPQTPENGYSYASPPIPAPYK